MSNKKLEVFNVLNFLNSSYELEDILKNGNFRSFSSSEECMDYLVENGYLLKNEDIKNYQLTDKAKNFLDDNQWIDLYMFALVAFKFDNYENYVENSDENMVNTALKFCDDVITAALLESQFIIFMDALSAKAHVYAYIGDYDSFIDYDLQRFIFGLNPIVMNSQTYVTYEIINYANIVNLKNVVEKLEINSLKKRFDKIWVKSNIKNITVSKKASFNILKRSLDGADIQKLNLELRNKYFDKKFGV